MGALPLAKARPEPTGHPWKVTLSTLVFSLTRWSKPVPLCLDVVTLAEPLHKSPHHQRGRAGPSNLTRHSAADAATTTTNSRFSVHNQLLPRR